MCNDLALISCSVGSHRRDPISGKHVYTRLNQPLSFSQQIYSGRQLGLVLSSYYSIFQSNPRREQRLQLRTLDFSPLRGNPKHYSCHLDETMMGVCKSFVSILYLEIYMHAQTKQQNLYKYMCICICIRQIYIYVCVCAVGFTYPTKNQKFKRNLSTT